MSWGIKRDDIVDTPLQGLCNTGDHGKLNAAAFTVLLTKQSENEVELSFQVGRRMLKFQTRVGPFYMADDPNQLNDAQYLVWHHVELDVSRG